MKKTLRLAAITLAMIMAISCKKNNGPQQRPRTDVTAEKLQVKTYEIISLISHQQLEERYNGTFGSMPVELLKTSDTTLAFFVPEVAPGEAKLKFELADINFRVAQTTVANADKFIADLTADFEAQVDLLNPVTPEEVAEINRLKAYRKEVVDLFNSLDAEEKRMTMHFYEANKEAISLLSNGTAMVPYRPMNSPVKTAQINGSNLANSGIVSAAPMVDDECPRTDFQSYYGCLASRLGREATQIVWGSAKVLTMLGLAQVSASLAPATFGISAVGTTLAAGAAGYLLATQVLPAITRFKQFVGPFLNANWIFTKALFETVAEEFASGINVHLNLKPAFRSITADDQDINAGASVFIAAMASLKSYWDKLAPIFGSFPAYQNSEKPTTLETNEVFISGVSNPNVQYGGNQGQSVTFTSLSGEEEDFSYDITVVKEGFLEKATLEGKVVPLQDSIEIYKAACMGTWTVKEYTLSTLTKTWTLTLAADEKGFYQSPAGGRIDIGWYILKTADGYAYREYVTQQGPWSYLERSSVIHKDPLTYPVTTFSWYYIGTTATYIKD